MNIFTRLDYRKIIRELLLEKREAFGVSAYSFQKLADACRVQKAYLSTVLNENAHFNADQTFLACQYLGLSPQETEYLDLLQSHERSIAPERREQLTKKIEQIKRQSLKTEKNIELKPSADIEEARKMNRYFLDPYLQIIHMILMIPKYATSHELIAKALKIPKSTVDQALHELIQMRVIKLDKNKITVLKEQVHLPRDAEFFEAHRTLLRLKSLDHLKTSEDQDKYSFSVVFTCDDQTRQSIHTKFLGFLKSVQSEVSEAESTGVYQMNFDLFSWLK